MLQPHSIRQSFARFRLKSIGDRRTLAKTEHVLRGKFAGSDLMSSNEESRAA